TASTSESWRPDRAATATRGGTGDIVRRGSTCPGWHPGVRRWRPQVASTEVSMSQQATGSGRQVRVGMIGCGDIATRVHLPGLLAAGARVTRFASDGLADAEAAAAASGDPE